VAKVADDLDKSSVNTRTSSQVAAPRGLTVGKTVADGADKPHLQFFEYDYVSVLEASWTTAARTPSPRDAPLRDIRRVHRREMVGSRHSLGQDVQDQRAVWRSDWRLPWP
jgi:hypothetical protein